MSNLGKKFSEETRQRMSEAKRGRTFTEEHRAALSEAQMGHVAPNRKMTFEVAEKIREEYAAGGVSQKKLADRYGVSQPVIFDIIKRKTYTS